MLNEGGTSGGISAFPRDFCKKVAEGGEQHLGEFGVDRGLRAEVCLGWGASLRPPPSLGKQGERSSQRLQHSQAR